MSDTRLPNRIYTEVSVEPVEDGWTVLLDGRTIRTPAKAVFKVAAEPLAEAIAAEWEAQGERVDPSTMPLSRLANTAIDRVAGREAAVAEEIAGYAGSDLLCYRADQPEGLVARQRSAWDPVLAWAKDAMSVEFVTVAGIMHRDQPADALDIVQRELKDEDALSLSALHIITTLSGSAILALALAKRALTPDEVWAAAHVDEDWQISQWGEDAEAADRRAERRKEFDAAAFVLLSQGTAATPTGCK